jgi:DNA polymerase III subunit delta
MDNMITTLTGANSFGLQNKLREIVAAFVAGNGDLAVERIDGQEAELAKIIEALNGLPFLSTKKLVVLRESGTNKQFTDQVEQILSDLPESTEVILVEPKLDKRLSYYKFLKKNTDFLEFAELDNNGLTRFLVDAAKVQNGTLSSSDARYLVERVGANQQLLSNELDKLLLYDKKVTRQTIDLLTEPAPQSTIFQLLEAAFAGNTQKALNLYAEQRALKVEPQQIIAMLTWQLHVLAIIKTAGDRQSGQIASEAKINPYVLGKSQGIARDLSLQEIKRLVSDLLVIDTESKSINIDTDEALQLYLIKLAN